MRHGNNAVKYFENTNKIWIIGQNTKTVKIIIEFMNEKYQWLFNVYSGISFRAALWLLTNNTWKLHKKYRTINIINVHMILNVWKQPLSWLTRYFRILFVNENYITFANK